MKFFEKGVVHNNSLMPTIGVAGVTIPGAVDCINKINKSSRQFFGDHQHPNIKLDQPDFSPTHHAQNESKWHVVADRLVKSISSLAESGASFAIIPANTVHIVISDVQKRSPIPVLNMLDIVADECQRKGFKTVGVLGTRWTMAYHLYKTPFEKRGIVEVIPSDEDQLIIQKVIFSELIPQGKASSEALSKLLQVVNNMKAKGCDGIILACTELPLALNTENCAMPTLDTNELLAQAAVNESLRLVNNPVNSLRAKL